MPRDLNKEKRSELEQARDQIVIVNMFFQGVKFTDMPKQLQERTGTDYELTFTSIKKQLDFATALWKEKQVIDVNERQNMELLKLDALENEYWMAWHRSCQKRYEKTTVKQKGIIIPSGEDANIEVDDAGNLLPIINSTIDVVETEQRIKEYDRDGNPKFLDGVEKCIKSRCLIMGLYQPLRVGMGGELPGGNEEYYDLPLQEIHQRLLAVFNIKNTTINIDNRKNGDAEN